MLTFIKKLLPKNLAGILGIIQAVFNVVRELLMCATRICATIIPGDADDKLVAKILNIFNKVESVFEKIKAFLLTL